MSRDITGQRFGRLIAVKLAEPYISPKGKKERRWVCKCDCGNEVIVLQHSITTGRTKSCGCLKPENPDNRKRDLTGQRFGKLTVLRLADEPYISSSGKKTRRWVCKCDCGNETTVLGNALTSGGTTSCGCALGGQITNDLTGKRFGHLLVLRRAPLKKPAASGEKNGWLCRCDCGKERVIRTESLVSGKTTSCGCQMAKKAGERIDSKGENKLGIYKGTMVSQINPNRPPNRNNSSGVKGVYWSSRDGRWVAKIGVKGRAITLGKFSRLEDAAAARKAAEEEYFKPLIEEYAEQQAKKEKENKPE